MPTGAGYKPIEPSPGGPGTARTSAEQATEQATAIGEQAASVVSAQKSYLAREVLGVASACRAAADQMRSGQPSVARYAEKMADQLHQLGRNIDSRGASELMRDVERLGREQPVLLCAGAALLGFAATRFLRASSEKAHEGEAGG